MTFISVEGLDGSGTTTLVEELSNVSNNVVTTFEPTNKKYGSMMRENLSQDTDPLEDFFLFMLDRRDHIENFIKPKDTAGQIVVSDRYIDSTRAYQPIALTEGEDAPFENTWQAKFFIEQTMADWEYEPDLTIYIDISVDTAIKRSSGEDKFENREFLEKARNNYLALADHHDRIITISGEQSVDEMVKEAIDVIDENI